jgi:Oxidoreductase molybdopterin binding domain
VHRRVDLALLAAALLGSFVTGVLGLWVGAGRAGVVVWAHGAAAMAVIVLAWSKAGVIRRGLRRRRPDVAGSLAAAVCAVGLIGSGVAHSMGVRDAGPLTALGWHIALAFVLLPLVAVHLARRPVLPRRGDLTRGAFLRLAGVSAAAVAGKVGFERVLGARRAPTGSLRQTAPSPTVWLNDTVPRIDPAAWRLSVAGRRVTVAELSQHAMHEWPCVLDCTSGWYAQNRWGGVPISALLRVPPGARSIEVRSATGYARRFDPSMAGRMLLATHLDGSPLTAEHGAPARLVVPGRRGFWWVKWVVEIRPDPAPPWWQAPFPL